MPSLLRALVVLFFGSLVAGALWLLWIGNRGVDDAKRKASRHSPVVKATQAVAEGPFLASLSWNEWPAQKGNAYLNIYRSDPRASGFEFSKDITDRIPRMRVRATATDFHGHEFDCQWGPTDDLGWYEMLLPFGETREMLPITVVPRAATRLELVPSLDGSESAMEALFVEIDGENDSELWESADVGIAISSVAGVVGTLGLCSLLVMALRSFRSALRGRSRP
jgi:hypothetical protein